MRIFISTSKCNVKDAYQIAHKLEQLGHTVIVSSFFKDSSTEEKSWSISPCAHERFKNKVRRESNRLIRSCDAILVLNLSNEKGQNYIGGAMFLEMYEAFVTGMTIYLYNDIPKGSLHDEIQSFDVTILHQNLQKIAGDDLTEFIDVKCETCPAFDELTSYCTINGNCHLRNEV